MRNTNEHKGLCELRTVLQARSERTRRRLLEVAIEVFSEFGFKAANTRTIVERADTNLVSIAYYFGSKEGLYLAAADYIGQRMAERAAPLCQWAEHSLVANPLTREETMDLYSRFIAGLAHTVLGGDFLSCWGKFIGREQLDPSPAAGILWHHFEPIFRVSLEFVCRLTGASPDSPHAILQNLTVFAIVKCSCVDSVGIAKAMNWAKFAGQMSAIEDVLVGNINALFASSRHDQ